MIKLKSEMGAGESGILPEMVKAMCCDGDCVEILVEFVRDVWAEGFGGKVVACVIQVRLKKLFITFVDLKKAYDSVPRQAL